MTIEECKRTNKIPERGTFVKISNKIRHRALCKGFCVSKKFLDNRKKDMLGVYLDYIPGAGGEVWLIMHEDSTIAAYMYDEVFDK